MTPHTLLDELHATITTLTAERDQVINEHARVAQLNTFLKEEVRLLSAKLEREILEGNRLREEARHVITSYVSLWDQLTGRRGGVYARQISRNTITI